MPECVYCRKTVNTLTDMATHPCPVPMRCGIDLDWCTYTCPCGENFCTRRKSDNETNAWIAIHRPHTDGTCLEHTTADGCRAWGGQPQPDQKVKL
jgi:hypothetical protein